jgi:hypothetical protein
VSHQLRALHSAASHVSNIDNPLDFEREVLAFLQGQYNALS